MTRGHFWGLALFGLVAAATWWAPLWPAEQALHSSLTVVALVALVVATKRWGLSVRAWTLFGVRLSEVFGWQRNHFDRLVHFAYGLCLTMMLRWRPLRAVEVVLATSAAYELLEWGIAVTLAPGLAEAYNGQQGDSWDAHKDMALALLGAIVAVVISLRLKFNPVDRAEGVTS